MTVTTAGIPIEVHLGPAELDQRLRTEVRAGLTAEQKWLSPMWLYDERGCELFDAITRLQEYYPTRTERSILATHANDMAAIAGADTLIELGSGTSEKTRVLLDAMSAASGLERFVAFDVAEPTMCDACAAIASEYAQLEVSGVVGDFEAHLDRLPHDGRRLVAFLGGTIGNLRPQQRQSFFRSLASTLRPGESLLLGTDLVKDRGRLERAYDDSAGVTREFNLNVLRVLNRELDADFDVDRFTHVARFDESNEWIEMRLRSQRRQVVHVGALDLEIWFEDGEDLLTEISAKFRRDGVQSELEAAGFSLDGWWTDDHGDFAVSLATR
jgi:L-histidine N-alpha-methyltransferase